MPYGTIRGSILCASTKSERNGVEHGREFFSLTQQVDGVDTMLAHFEIDGLWVMT